MDNNVHVCDACGKAGVMVACNRCKVAKYCGQKCGQQHRPQHHITCDAQLHGSNIGQGAVDVMRQNWERRKTMQRETDEDLGKFIFDHAPTPAQLANVPPVPSEIRHRIVNHPSIKDYPIYVEYELELAQRMRLAMYQREVIRTWYNGALRLLGANEALINAVGSQWDQMTTEMANEAASMFEDTAKDRVYVNKNVVEKLTTRLRSIQSMLFGQLCGEEVAKTFWADTLQYEQDKALSHLYAEQCFLYIKAIYEEIRDDPSVFPEQDQKPLLGWMLRRMKHGSFYRKNVQRKRVDSPVPIDGWLDWIWGGDKDGEKEKRKSWLDDEFPEEDEDQDPPFQDKGKEEEDDEEEYEADSSDYENVIAKLTTSDGTTFTAFTGSQRPRGVAHIPGLSRKMLQATLDWYGSREPQRRSQVAKKTFARMEVTLRDMQVETEGFWWKLHDLVFDYATKDLAGSVFGALVTAASFGTVVFLSKLWAMSIINKSDEAKQALENTRVIIRNETEAVMDTVELLKNKMAYLAGNLTQIRENMDPDTWTRVAYVARAQALQEAGRLTPEITKTLAGETLQVIEQFLAEQEPMIPIYQAPFKTTIEMLNDPDKAEMAMNAYVNYMNALPLIGQYGPRATKDLIDATEQVKSVTMSALENMQQDIDSIRPMLSSMRDNMTTVSSMVSDLGDHVPHINATLDAFDAGDVFEKHIRFVLGDGAVNMLVQNVIEPGKVWANSMHSFLKSQQGRDTIKAVGSEVGTVFLLSHMPNMLTFLGTFGIINGHYVNSLFMAIRFLNRRWRPTEGQLNQLLVALEKDTLEGTRDDEGTNLAMQVLNERRVLRPGANERNVRAIARRHLRMRAWRNLMRGNDMALGLFTRYHVAIDLSLITAGLVQEYSVASGLWGAITSIPSAIVETSRFATGYMGEHPYEFYILMAVASYKLVRYGWDWWNTSENTRRLLAEGYLEEQTSLLDQRIELAIDAPQYYYLYETGKTLYTADKVQMLQRAQSVLGMIAEPLYQWGWSIAGAAWGMTGLGDEMDQRVIQEMLRAQRRATFLKQ